MVSARSCDLFPTYFSNKKILKPGNTRNIRAVCHVGLGTRRFRQLPPSHSLRLTPAPRKHQSEVSPRLSTVAAARFGRPVQPASPNETHLPFRNPTGRSPRAAHCHHASPNICGRLYKTRPHHLPSATSLSSPFLLGSRPCLPSRATSSPARPPAPLPASPPRRPQRSPGPPRTPLLRLRLPPPARARTRPPSRRRPSHPASRGASSAVTAPPRALRRPRPPSSSAGSRPLVWVTSLMGFTWSNYCICFGCSVSDRVSVSAFPTSATKNSYDEILTSLGKPGGGAEFGKYYSLPALSDPRIGEFLGPILYFFCEKLSRCRSDVVLSFVCCG